MPPPKKIILFFQKLKFSRETTYYRSVDIFYRNCEICDNREKRNIALIIADEQLTKFIHSEDADLITLC